MSPGTKFANEEVHRLTSQSPMTIKGRLSMRTIFLVGSVFLSGCATQPPYVAPTHGPLANISFVNLSSDIPTTVLFYEDGIACRGIRRVAFYNANYKNSLVTVSANKPFTFTIDHSTTRAYCRQTYMFTPEPSDYRIRTQTGAGECSVLVEKGQEVAPGQSQWTPVKELTKREYRAPFFESGEWCAPL